MRPRFEPRSSCNMLCALTNSHSSDCLFSEKCSIFNFRPVKHNSKTVKLIFHTLKETEGRTSKRKDLQIDSLTNMITYFRKETPPDPRLDRSFLIKEVDCTYESISQATGHFCSPENLDFEICKIL